MNTGQIQNFILKHAYMYFAVRVKSEISDLGAMQDTRWQK